MENIFVIVKEVKTDSCVENLTTTIIGGYTNESDALVALQVIDSQIDDSGLVFKNLDLTMKTLSFATDSFYSQQRVTYRIKEVQMNKYL